MRKKNLDFTDREQEVLDALGDGDTSYKALADRLGVTTDTIHTHLYRMYEKADVHSKTELVVVAAQRGWLAKLLGRK